MDLTRVGRVPHAAKQQNKSCPAPAPALPTLCLCRCLVKMFVLKYCVCAYIGCCDHYIVMCNREAINWRDHVITLNTSIVSLTSHFTFFMYFLFVASSLCFSFANTTCHFAIIPVVLQVILLLKLNEPFKISKAYALSSLCNIIVKLVYIYSLSTYRTGKHLFLQLILNILLILHNNRVIHYN